jgi:hypothetical protein
MVYKHHQIWRDKLGIGAGWQDIPSKYHFKNHLKNLRRSHPIIPYTLEIECNSYWGQFEREFIAYSMGILDDVQMDINHSEEERTMFWKEVFGKDAPIEFNEALESYELLRDYLFETFQDVDDWEQLTFYQIDWEIMHKNGSNVLKIQLAKPFDYYWQSIIIPRMKDFFTKKPYEYMDKDAELISIALCDSKGNVVKEY